jgi:hypothetical protein
MSFSINLKSPAAKIVEYTSVLLMADVPRLKGRNINIVDDRALQFCAFANARHFDEYGKIASWYDVSEIKTRLRNGSRIYDRKGIVTLEKDVENQKPFIFTIQSSRIDLGKPFPEESLIRYEKFMLLVKKYGEKNLIPPLDVVMVWKAHKLDHEAYKRAVEDYVGRLVDQSDGQTKSGRMKTFSEHTEKLWEKHFGLTYDNFEFCTWLHSRTASITEELD